MRNILITGAAGFIGSNALDYFIANPDYKVIVVVDKLTYASDRRRVEKYPDVQLLELGIEEIAWTTMLRRFPMNAPDIIVNFAAESHVDNSIKQGGYEAFITSNYTGVASILFGIREYQIQTGKKIFFLQVSTDEVLGDLPLDDDTDGCMTLDRLVPNNPYAATKAAAEQFIQACHHTYKDFDYMIVRATNNYGPNQHDEKFIPTIIRSIFQKKQIPIYGKGENVREWLYVEDFIRGIDAAINYYYECKALGEPFKNIYHFGSGVRVTNLGLVTLLLNMMDASYRFISYVPDRPGHDRKYALDSLQSNVELGWVPQQDFTAGLEIVIKDIKKRLFRSGG